MDKKTVEARKLANKFIADCMESPLSLELCMTVMAHVLVDYAVTYEVPLEDVLKDMGKLYQMCKLEQSEPTGVMH